MATIINIYPDVPHSVKHGVGEYVWRWSFLHGTAKEDARTNLFTSDEPMPTKPGNYPASINGKPAMAAVRQGKRWMEGRIVYIEDMEAMEHLAPLNAHNWK